MSYIKKQNKKIDSMLPNKDDISDLSINDKFILFNNLLTRCDLVNTDFIAYANKLISTLGLNINTKLFYDTEKSNRFLLNINIEEIYNENQKGVISYTIDSIDKKIYDQPPVSYEFKENITNKRRT